MLNVEKFVTLKKKRNMKKLFVLTLFLSALMSCNNTTNQKTESTDEFESFVVKESLDAGAYVYILGEQGEDTKWFAITAQEVKEGDMYYYTEPLVMKDFYSKELDRPFDEVVFLMKVSKDPKDLQQTEAMPSDKPSGKVTTDQLVIEIDIPEGAISIAKLFENMEEYQGQKVKIRGKVIKFSPEIMNTNWIHLQDGTTYDGKYDLTITSNETVVIGDDVTFEGTIVLDKDFGHGYFYEVLMEEAVIVK